MRVCQKRKAFLFCALVALFLCYSHAAEGLSRDSVMFLFVQDNVELTYSRGHGSPGATYSDSSIAEMQRKIQRENDSAEYLQKALTSALAEDRMDDFKAIWDTVREFESTATYKKIVFRDRFLVKYFLEDYTFLCNLDSVKKYNPSKYVDGVFGATALEKIATQRTSGELEKKLGRIADEADRAFVRILLLSLFESREQVSALIEKYKPQLKKREQLEYLVERFWTKSGYDLKNYFGATFVAPVAVPLGDISDKVRINFGGGMEIDLFRNRLAYGFYLGIQTGECREQDSLELQTLAADFNLGYTFLDLKYVNLRAFVSGGVGYSSLKYVDSDKSDNSLSSQVFPAFGAGAMVDVFFMDYKKVRVGLRIRGGIKNIWADDVVNASGYNLYASLELALFEYKQKNFEFDYSDREGAK